MTDPLTLSPIGHTDTQDGGFIIQLWPNTRPGLTGLSGFSHAIVLWWAHNADSAEARTRLSIQSPYTATSANIGVFATRSEARPNPIGMSVISIAAIDPDAGRVDAHYFDMLPGTPILDLKPYFPASDRVSDARVPAHFDHWPTSLEASATFDWDREFRH
ncbi:tRNA (N6-threonylcarbamoyladenosine(37)-N6)-methyltransferase TrmO [Roseobacter cerasinus]|uniref:tRNA (N6-threonylcarbamoyladenosine(37)-N6)-methyltransferase TrmO n=1 Tax=Roseobacter cerasinus TaxID=2602289 RepID=A0A640VXQ6_9RHOB|nr:TrmO family methyltransferase [Roseobacter cerasinus]GFE51881.1 tRNA (N6-threonylcarbamoyladenosine(37)-N6)-methyltransferase TrmO [Roseobacter cerasinus]